MGGKMGEERRAAPPPPPPPYYRNPPDYDSSEYILLPRYSHDHHHYHHLSSSIRYIRRTIFSFFYYAVVPIALISAAAFFLWPSKPELELVRLRLDNVAVSSKGPVSIDISMDLTIKVRNRDFFSLDSRSLLVSIGYRGSPLGIVSSHGARIRARGSSYIDATLHLDGIEILHDVLYLLEDLARGYIPFDTVTDFSGRLGLFFLDIPLQARLSCEVDVSTKNQTVIRQDCYPE